VKKIFLIILIFLTSANAHGDEFMLKKCKEMINKTEQPYTCFYFITAIMDYERTMESRGTKDAEFCIRGANMGQITNAYIAWQNIL
jgi:hypothetical protein